MSGPFFDDDQEIGPQTLMLLREVLADLLREGGEAFGSDEQLTLAKELIALYKSGFRSEAELKAMVMSHNLLDAD